MSSSPSAPPPACRCARRRRQSSCRPAADQQQTRPGAEPARLRPSAGTTWTARARSRWSSSSSILRSGTSNTNVRPSTQRPPPCLLARAPRAHRRAGPAPARQLSPRGSSSAFTPPPAPRRIRRQEQELCGAARRARGPRPRRACGAYVHGPRQGPGPERPRHHRLLLHPSRSSTATAFPSDSSSVSTFPITAITATATAPPPPPPPPTSTTATASTHTATSPLFLGRAAP